MISFCRDEISTRPAGTDFTLDYMKKSIFIPARQDSFPPGICLQKPIDSHWFKNVHRVMKFYKDICLLFVLLYFTTVYWNAILWIFFILMCYLNFPLRLGGLKRLYGKIWSGQSGILAVQKRDPALRGWNFSHIIIVYDLWRIYNTAGIPTKQDKISCQSIWIM